MIAPESNPTTSHGADGVAAPPAPSDQPVTTLRGASVSVDTRRASQVVIGVCLAALAVVGIVLLIAGIQKNSQVTNLRQHGVPVTVTVASCDGLMGGSGSNLAGYSCTGTYTFHGHQYRQGIPGIAFHATGSSLQGVTVASDPKLLSTPREVAEERASWRVFIIPAVLLIVCLAVLALLIVLSRRKARPPSPARTETPEPR
jgi:hypothetical protein